MGPIQRLATLLDDEGVDYALIGGHAVNVFLEPRLTRDIDVTIVAGAEEVERLRTALAALGFESSLEVGDELPSGPDFVRFVKDEVVIEMQAAKTALQREVVDRATSLSGIRLATPEDLIAESTRGATTHCRCSSNATMKDRQVENCLAPRRLGARKASPSKVSQRMSMPSVAVGRTFRSTLDRFAMFLGPPISRLRFMTGWPPRCSLLY